MEKTIAVIIIFFAALSGAALLLIAHHFGPILPVALVVGFGATFSSYINAYIDPEIEDIATMLAGFIPSGIFVVLAKYFHASYTAAAGHISHPWGDKVFPFLLPTLVATLLGLFGMVSHQEDRTALAIITAICQAVCVLGSWLIATMSISGSWI